MNKPVIKRTLIGAAVLAVIGTVGTQTYVTHQLSERLAAQQVSRPAAVNGRDSTVQYTFSQDPWAAMHADMMRMQAQMDQLFNASFKEPGPGAIGDTRTASVTLKDQGDNYVVKADIPEAKEKDINVKLDGQVLSIASHRQESEEQKDDDGQVISGESYSSSFQQAFTLPGPVDASAMKTRFKDGVLTVTIPKALS